MINSLALSKEDVKIGNIKIGGTQTKEFGPLKDEVHQILTVTSRMRVRIDLKYRYCYTSIGSPPEVPSMRPHRGYLTFYDQ